MKEKTIIITGAGMGLGYATAKELASKGANLVLVDYNEKAFGATPRSSQISCISFK